MEKQPTITNRTYLGILAILGWFALTLQFYLMMGNRTVSISETIIRYFSFYTILTNILVASSSTLILLQPKSSLGKFFSQTSVKVAIAVYITIVGVVYNAILRYIWNPLGWDKVADELLHLIIPLLFIFYWLLFAHKEKLKWTNSFSWLIYPLVYFVWVLIFGALSGFYPYPFVNVTKLGYSTAFLNSGIITIGLFLLSLLYILINNAINSKVK